MSNTLPQVGTPVSVLAAVGTNGKAVGSTLVYSTPTDQRAIMTKVIVQVMVASGNVSHGFSAGLGTAAGTNDIVASQFFDLTKGNDVFEIKFEKTKALMGDLYFNIDSPITGTLELVGVHLLGYVF